MFVCWNWFSIQLPHTQENSKQFNTFPIFLSIGSRLGILIPDDLYLGVSVDNAEKLITDVPACMFTVISTPAGEKFITRLRRSMKEHAYTYIDTYQYIHYNFVVWKNLITFQWSLDTYRRINVCRCTGYKLQKNAHGLKLNEQLSIWLGYVLVKVIFYVLENFKV